MVIVMSIGVLSRIVPSFMDRMRESRHNEASIVTSGDGRLQRNLLLLLVKYGLGLGLLAWVMAAYWHIYTPEPNSEDVGLAGVFERPVHWHFLVMACLLELTSVLMTFVRWFYLVRAPELRFKFASALRLGMISFYLEHIPARRGGRRHHQSGFRRARAKPAHRRRRHRHHRSRDRPVWIDLADGAGGRLLLADGSARGDRDRA